jgi:peptidoglycan/LPS O-acetylase OafA/YrhL
VVVQNTEASLQIADVSKHRHAFIQGLRAIAVIAVVAYHAGLPLPGGLCRSRRILRNLWFRDYANAPSRI